MPYTAEARGIAYPVAAPGMVLVTEAYLDDHSVMCFDDRDGALRWRFAGQRNLTSPVCIAGDAVYTASSEGIVYAVGASDGAPHWSYQTGGKLLSTPAVRDDAVYVGASDGYVYGVNAAGGQPLH